MGNLKFFIKKYLLVFLTVVISLFLTTGCTKVTYTFDIGNENTTISEIRAVDFSKKLNEKKYYEKLIDKKISSKNKDSKGYDITKYVESSFLGIQKTKTVPTYRFGNDSLPLGFSTPQKNVVEFERGLFKNKYVVYLQYNPDVIKDITSKTIDTFAKKTTNNNKQKVSTDESLNNTQSLNKKQYKTPEPLDENSALNNDIKNAENTFEINGQNFTQAISIASSQNNKNLDDKENISEIKTNLELVIRIPKKANSHNANEVINDREYKWVLSDEYGTEINIEYTKYDFSTIAWLITFTVLISMLMFYYEKFKHGGE